MDASSAEHRPLLALLLRLGAAGSLASMAALIKYVHDTGIHLIEILFWRQALAIPVVIVWALATTGSLAVFATRRPGAHVRRGLFGLTGMVLNFAAVVLLPLAEATTMNFTAPIWAVILSMLLLKDKVGIWRWSAVLLGFAGIVLIAQPGSGHIPLLGASVALGGAFMIALISIQIADLNKTEQPITIVFWFAMIAAPVCGLALPWVFSAHSPLQWALLAAMGVMGTLGQILLTASLRYGKVASVIVMDYSSLFWATLYGWLVWDTLPTPWTWLGAPLVVAAGLLITWREHVLARRAFVDQRQLGN